MKIKRKIKSLFPLLILFIFLICVVGFLSSASVVIVENLNKVNNFTNTLSENIHMINSLSNVTNDRINDTFISEKANTNLHTLENRDSLEEKSFNHTNNTEYDIFEGMDDYTKNNTLFTMWNNSLDLEHSKNAFYYSGVLPKEELRLNKSRSLELDPKLDCYRYTLVNSSYNDTVFNISADGHFTFITNNTNITNMSFKIEINNPFFFIKKFFMVNIIIPVENNILMNNDKNMTNETINNMTNETITNLTDNFL